MAKLLLVEQKKSISLKTKIGNCSKGTEILNENCIVHKRKLRDLIKFWQSVKMGPKLSSRDHQVIKATIPPPPTL